MSANELKDLSRAEWKVMKVVWDLGKAMAREIYTVASEQWSWSPATVKTILKRLVDKGYVSTTQVGKRIRLSTCAKCFIDTAIGGR